MDGFAEALYQSIFNIDREAVRAYVRRLRENHPIEKEDALIQRVIRDARLRTTLTGIATGLPSNLAVAIPAAVADLSVVYRLEVFMAACMAEIYDSEFLDDEASFYELLIQILGGQVVSQVLRELGVKAGMSISREFIKKYISKEFLKLIKKIALKYLGLKLTQRALIAKAVPVLGGIIGGAWNNAETEVVARRVIYYFNPDRIRYYSIFHAIRKYDVEAARSFTENGESPNQTRPNGSTPMHYAAERNLDDFIEYLIEKGANINHPNKCGDTPLHLASERGNLEAMSMLIMNEAKVSEQNHKGMTPLHMAIFKGMNEAGELLAANGAEIEIRDRDGNSVLHYAARKNDVRSLKLFLEKKKLF